MREAADIVPLAEGVEHWQDTQCRRSFGTLFVLWMQLVESDSAVTICD